ncbi:MAG TPA: hypothetical protein VMB50_10450 [Myxococcales bacterium]|nr:hypothetical protein [Myxococcales bacterium]
MRKLFLLPLLLAAACQGNVTENKPDGGDAGVDAGPADSGVPNHVPLADGGVCSPACTAPTPYCATNGTCVQCASDTDCVGQGEPHCDTLADQYFGTCVECVPGVAGECGTGEACAPGQDNCVAGGCSSNPSACSANGQNQVCDPASGACVDCLSNSDCSAGGGGAICDTVSDSCVDCLKPSDCPASQPGCSQGTCGQCNLSSDCPSGMTCLNQTCSCTTNASCPSATPICIPDGGGAQFGGPGQPVCGCSQKSDCASAGSGYVCDPNQGQDGLCVPPCTSDNDCLANPDTGTGVCDTSTGLCVECATASDCTDPDSPFCVGGSCGECGVDGDCAALDAGTPFCVSPQGQGTLCGECRTAADCPADNPGCDSSSYTCGSCTYNSDCPASAPVCDADAGLTCD